MGGEGHVRCEAGVGLSPFAGDKRVIEGDKPRSSEDGDSLTSSCVA